MTKLSVNLNKIALLRNSRTIGVPSVTRAGTICVEAGADGLTVHPRPDQRHIRPDDVFDLARLVAERPGLEFNIEGNPTPEFLSLVAKVRPHQCTLVPDDPSQLTSDHGWDVAREGGRLKPIVRELKGTGVRVSLFMDPDPEQIARAAETGADRVELYTEPYARAFELGEAGRSLAIYGAAAAKAREAGLGLNAGHDLNLDNLPAFIKIPGILEVSIGHALISDALEMGLDAAVKAYLKALGR